MDDERRITLWTRPEEIIETAYGRMTYREWCERERERLTGRGDHVEIVTNEDGLIALVR